MRLRELVEKYHGIEVKDLCSLLKEVEYYEELGDQYQDDFSRIKERIQLGCHPNWTRRNKSLI